MCQIAVFADKKLPLHVEAAECNPGTDNPCPVLYVRNLDRGSDLTIHCRTWEQIESLYQSLWAILADRVTVRIVDYLDDHTGPLPSEAAPNNDDRCLCGHRRGLHGEKVGCLHHTAGGTDYCSCATFNLSSRAPARPE